jgi:hypothetical protein
MKQDKKKFQVGDTVLVGSGDRAATVVDIDPWYVYVKYDVFVDDESEALFDAVPRCRIVPTIDRKPTLRQKIVLWWYDLSADVKAVFIMSVINAVVLIGWAIAVSIIK